jgi:hypothetical protein
MPVRSPFAFVRFAPLVYPSLNLQTHIVAIARRWRAPDLRANDPNCCNRYRDSRSNPMAADLPRRCLPFVTRIAFRFRNLMRPTGEASGPVSGDFVVP